MLVSARISASALSVKDKPSPLQGLKPISANVFHSLLYLAGLLLTTPSLTADWQRTAQRRWKSVGFGVAGCPKVLFHWGVAFSPCRDPSYLRTFCLNCYDTSCAWYENNNRRILGTLKIDVFDLVDCMLFCSQNRQNSCHCSSDSFSHAMADFCAFSLEPYVIKGVRGLLDPTSVAGDDGVVTALVMPRSRIGRRSCMRRCLSVVGSNAWVCLFVGRFIV